MILEKDYERISKKAVRCWQIKGAIFSGFVTAALLVVYFLWFKHWYILPVIPAVIALKCFILPAIEYRQWQYRVEADRVEIIHGIFILQWGIIPINRIQHLKIEQGFLQKRFDISNVTIYTAGAIQWIKALPSDRAKQIIDQLNKAIVSEEGEQNE